MAQRSKQENYDALGSIFDFIFKESKKSPDKRRPIKPTGISGESMLTDALAASLEMPGAFITNNIIDEFNDMLDIKLADFKLDDQTKVSISSNNVIDFLRDPNTFIQKQIDRGKGVRKANRIRFLGEVMDDYLTTAWAHQYGDLEAKEIALARAGANENSEKYKVNRAVGQNIRLDTLSNSDFTRDRSIELIGRKTFGKRWDSMGEQEKFEFMDRLTETGPTIFKNPKTGKTDVSKDWGGGVASESVQEYLVQRYGREEAKNFSLATHSRKGTDKIDLSNSELYRTLETDYLDGKVEALKGASSGTEEEKKRKIYEKSRLMVNLRNENQLNNLKKALEQETDADKKVEIEKAIQLGEMARRALGDRNNFLAPLGKIEGWVDSINRVYGGILAPNLVVSVLKGDFFDARKNTFLCPTTSGKAGGVDIIKAKEGKNKFTNTYNKMSETIYYLTPKAALRTLFFNGEGFAFLLSKQLESLQDIQGLSQKELLGKFNDKLTNKDFDAFMKTTLIKMKASGISAKDLARIEATLKKAKGLQNLINIFSWPSKFKSAIESSINKVLVRNRARFARILLKNKSLRNWMIKSGAGKLLGTWITQGGLKTLVRSLVTAIAGSAGLVLTPLGSAFVTAVTWVLTDLIIKLGKLLTTVGMLFALGVIGIFVLMVSLGSGSVRKWQKEVYSYTHVIPGKVEICPDYGFTEPIPVEPIVGPVGPTPDVPECVGGGTLEDAFNIAKDFVSQNYAPVSTSLEIVDCPGHPMCVLIDWAWCYSSDKIYCSREKVSGASCDYFVSLSVHELIHQIQGSDSTLMAEWGADYLSKNGGGYKFVTSAGGCVSATQMPLPSSCDEEGAKNAALGWDTSSACYRDIAGMIDGFCWD